MRKKFVLLLMFAALLGPIGIGNSTLFAQHRHGSRNKYMIGGGLAGAVIGGLAGGGKGALIGGGAGVAGGYLAHRIIHKRHERRYAYYRRSETYRGRYPSRRYYYARR